MRTLTQVWVFLVSLTFLLLVLGFQLLGRPGLFFAFILSLLFLYAALQRSLSLFRGRLNIREYSGNDPTGFIGELELHKVKFGLKKIFVHTSSVRIPPLVWQNNANEGHIILNERLLPQLAPLEVRLLALLTLAHLESRSFILSQVLSILKIHIFLLSKFSALFSASLNSLFKTSAEIYTADSKFKSFSECSDFEVGYFLNKLHKFNFNQNYKPDAYYFFSVLSLPYRSQLNEYGVPQLDLRLKKIMGFAL